MPRQPAGQPRSPQDDVSPLLALFWLLAGGWLCRVLNFLAHAR